MIKLLKLHGYQLLHDKSRVFLTIYGLMTFALFAFVARVFDARSAKIIHRIQYEQDYFLEALYFLKLAVILFMVFLTIQLFILSPLDVVLVQRVGRLKVIISKWLMLFLGAIIYVSMSLVYFRLIGFLSGVFMHDIQGWNVVLSFFGLCVFYSFLLAFVAIKSDHIFALFCVFLGFVLSDIFIDVSGTSQPYLPVQIIQLLFYNIQIQPNLTIRHDLPISMMVPIALIYALLSLVSYHKRPL